jgi:hypothetical protein
MTQESQRVRLVWVRTRATTTQTSSTDVGQLSSSRVAHQTRLAQANARAVSQPGPRRSQKNPRPATGTADSTIANCSAG